MLHDLYLMSANLSLEADTRRNFNHRALSFTEMAASCKRRECNPAARKSGSVHKNLFLAIIEGVARA